MAALVCAQDVVDSMVYGNNKMEWQVYATEGQVTAFAPRGNTVWYATAAQAGAINMKTGKKQLFQKLGEMPAAGITTVAIDCTGGVWLGGPNGVATTTNGASFTVFTSENGLPDNAVNVVFPTKGGVWIGTDNGLAAYQGGSFKSFTTENGLAGNSVRDITVDGKGVVWLGTNKGIATYNGGTWGTHDMNSGLSWNDVKAIAFDTRKEVIWAAVGDADINAYDGKEWEVFMQIQPGISCIMTDTQSRIWFGSDEGLLKYNGFEWVYDPQKIGVPATVVADMHRAGNGDLWFGIDTGVLHMSNPYPF
jgi:ligand-binding sensor domain-containing protein